MEKPDDNHYIEKVMAGETAAFAVLIDRHKDLVFTLAMNISRNREDAEEIAQDAFLKAYQKLATFRMESRFSTWLYRIAYNEAISKMRKNRMMTVDLGDDISEILPEEPIENEVAGLNPQEQLSAVTKILELLPETDRVLVTLFYLDNLPVADISEVTGLSESNVKVRLHRVRKKMFQEMQHLINRNNIRILK